MTDCCAVKETPAAPPGATSCPGCGSRAKQVDILTVKSLVRHLPFGMVKAHYYFCDTPGCDIVYFPFGADAPTFRRGDLLVRVGAKETADPIPVCYCFGLTRKAIWDEIQQTGRSTFGERIKVEVKAGNCACELKNPSGKCCLGKVARAAQDGFRTLEASPR